MSMRLSKPTECAAPVSSVGSRCLTGTEFLSERRLVEMVAEERESTLCH